MGFALQWAAVKNGSLESICSVFGLRPTGEQEDFAESDIVGAELPTNWTLVIFQRDTISDEHLKKLSMMGDVVSCFVEDHVMFSTASSWKNNAQIWSVTHDCEKGLAHLEIEGAAPSELSEIHQRLLKELANHGGSKSDTDYPYDSPAELCKALVGFRHDQDVEGASGQIFKVLERAAPQGQKGLLNALGRIFGKKERAK